MRSVEPVNANSSLNQALVSNIQSLWRFAYKQVAVTLVKVCQFKFLCFLSKEQHSSPTWTILHNSFLFFFVRWRGAVLIICGVGGRDGRNGGGLEV
jgi:hypothetical protein